MGNLRRIWRRPRGGRVPRPCLWGATDGFGSTSAVLDHHRPRSCAWCRASSTLTTEPACTPAGLFFGSILRVMRNGATGFARGNALAEALSLTSTRACLHAREAMDRFGLIRYAPGERILQRPR